MTNSVQPPLGIYIHWPYCARICPYCDFNVYKTRDINVGLWRDMLRRDLAHWAKVSQGRVLTSIYWGGGTPSLAPPELVAAVIDDCRSLWPSIRDAEITLEANPTDTEMRRLQMFRDAGVNRLSLGVQSVRDATLKFLGRNHTAAEALRGIETGLSVFANMSVDLIYATPEQSTDDWANELRDVIALGAPHLSLYQLTIEPETAFARAHARGTLKTPAEDVAADLYSVTASVTSAAGLPAYEVSNHARSGFEAKHNSLYWNADDYIGVGPGAHGRLQIDGVRHAIETARDPAGYLDRVATQGSGAVTIDPLSPAEQFIEKFAMGLRRTRGIVLTDEDQQALSPKIRELAHDGLLIADGSRIAVTPTGRLVLNSVIGALIA